MNIQLMSDLHFEFHPDHGVSWINSLDPSGVDVLILAGDIAKVQGGGVKTALELFCERYPQVIFVPGNHEYYGADIQDAERHFDALDAQLDHLHILRGRTVELGGQRFVGATLWFTERDDPSHALLTQMLNDFHKIKGGFAEWVYERAAHDARFLAQSVQPGDVVITHHIPSRRGVAPRWQSSIEGFGRFFLHELPEPLVQRARLWCHGHGHDSVMTTQGEHCLAANPFGYLQHEENPAFNPRLIFEL